MKVGILTFHFVDNFGAVLQAYALQQTLVNQKVEAEIIDYRPSYIYDKYRMRFSDIAKHPRKVLNNIIQHDYKRKQHEKFINFSYKYINLSHSVYKKINKEIVNEYDYFITGSDQVWNPIITGRDSTYFLNFVHDSNKKVAYAASVGRNVNSEIETFVLENTEDFYKVSIREEEVARHFNSLGKKFETVLDPTFLLSKDEWIKVESAPSNLPEHYVLVYDLECRKDILEMATRKAKEENIQLVTIHPLNKNYYGHSNLVGVGPEEFIYLFHNADYVYTNSFHGLVFSTIFNKKVFVIEHSTGNSRLMNLINVLNLEMIEEINNDGCKAKMYLNGQQIESKINESLEFLFNSLNK